MLAGVACIKAGMREANRSGARFGGAGLACLRASAVLAMFHPREALPLGGTIACERGVHINTWALLSSWVALTCAYPDQGG